MKLDGRGWDEIGKALSFICFFLMVNLNIIMIKQLLDLWGVIMCDCVVLRKMTKYMGRKILQ